MNPVMKMAINHLEQAPEFTLSDTQNNLIRLTDYCSKKSVVLVFNRGFA
jgi:peroxiredoxin